MRDVKCSLFNKQCLSLFFRNLEKSLLRRRRMSVTYTTKPTLWSLFFEKLAHKLSQSYQWTALFTQWRVSRFFDVFSKQLMARHPSVQSLFTAFVTLDKATAASEKMAAFHGNPAKFIVSRNFLPFARNVNQSFWSAGKLDQATPVLQLLREVGLFLWQANAINGVSNRKRSEDNYFRSD